MKTILLALGLCALAGCAITQDIMLPDGSPGLTVECSGMAQTWTACMKKAGERCPKGYALLGGGNESTAMTAGTGGFSASPYAASGGSALWATNTMNRVMVIKCA
jgi:hypothetical protein